MFSVIYLVSNYLLFTSYYEKTDFWRFTHVFSRAITLLQIVCSNSNSACMFVLTCIKTFVICVIQKNVFLVFCYINIGGHLGFLVVIPVPQKFWLGTVAVFNLCILSMICAKFGAFNPKPTIFTQICCTIASDR